MAPGDDVIEAQNDIVEIEVEWSDQADAAYEAYVADVTAADTPDDD